MRAWRKCLQQRRNVGTCLSSCHLNKHNLINSLRANLDERTLSSDDALKTLPPKISPFLQEGPQVGVNERRKKKWPRAWYSGLLWMVFDGQVAQGSAGHKKPPAGRPSPEGASAHAPPGYFPTRRAYEQGGVSIAVLLKQGLLPDRSSCQDVFGFTDPTSFYMSHSRVGVKSSWVFLL
jgi:hypothetical protein